LFYAKILGKSGEFIGKIYKVSPDGNWFGKIIWGEDPTFEKVKYKPSHDENQVVQVLTSTYEEVSIVDPIEFKDYVNAEEIDEWGMNTIAS